MAAAKSKQGKRKQAWSEELQEESGWTRSSEQTAPQEKRGEAGTKYTNLIDEVEQDEEMPIEE